MANVTFEEYEEQLKKQRLTKNSTGTYWFLKSNFVLNKNQKKCSFCNKSYIGIYLGRGFHAYYCEEHIDYKDKLSIIHHRILNEKIKEKEQDGI